VINNEGDNLMGRFIVIIGGLIAMAGAIYLAIYVWWREFYELVFATIPPLLFLGGLAALIAGISSIKDKKRIEKLEEGSPEIQAEE
jgi:hypothetical protein